MPDQSYLIAVPMKSWALSIFKFGAMPPIILLGKPPPPVEDSKRLTVPGVKNKQPSLS
jgi:hypothetical protein